MWQIRSMIRERLSCSASKQIPVRQRVRSRVSFLLTTKATAPVVATKAVHPQGVRLSAVDAVTNGNKLQEAVLWEHY